LQALLTLARIEGVLEDTIQDAANAEGRLDDGRRVVLAMHFLGDGLDCDHVLADGVGNAIN
jgi:hypothetical protein